MADPLRFLPPEVQAAIIDNAEHERPMTREQARYFVEKYPELSVGLMHANDELEGLE